jgi:hypothetical protein
MIEPASVTLTAGQKQHFYSDGDRWMFSPSVGELADGAYTAPKLTLISKVVLVTAGDPNDPAKGGTAAITLSSSPFWMGAIAVFWCLLLPLLAVAFFHVWPAALVTLAASPEAGKPAAAQLLWLAVVAGAIGSSLGAVRSFVNYVGSRHFAPSWSLYYILHPTFGAGLALLVHMGHRTGMAGASGNANDPAVVGFYSGLVGLFSDVALQKLRDAVGTIFGMQDQRTDKMPSGPMADHGHAFASGSAAGPEP